jgi:hypothetical protein
MEEKPITFNKIWQNKPARYAVMSLAALMIMAVVAPFFPHLWPVWILVYFVSTWIITAREQKGAQTNGSREKNPS